MSLPARKQLGTWQVFAGQALYDPDVPPIVIHMEMEVLSALWHNYAPAWIAVLETIADDIKQGSA